jgi:RNA polymerase sigma-70 factor (ECF subfamily)
MTSESLPLPDEERATPEDLLAHAAWVRRLARALVGDVHAADDVVQDTWLAALRNPPAADRPVRPWLARVVANVARNRRRGERRRADHESAPRPGTDVPSPREIAAEIEMQRLLLDAIETLAEAQRSTLVRHYFHGQTTAAIARADSVSETTVRTRIAHAVEALRKKLDDRHRGDRAAWMALVMPCARHETHVATTAAASVAGTLIAMNVLIKVGVAAVVLIIALGVYELGVKGVIEPQSPSASHLVAGTDALGDSSRITPIQIGRNRVGMGSESTAPTSPEAPREEVGIVEMIVRDARGAAVPGAVMTCVGGSNGENLPIEGIPPWTTDKEGRAHQALPLEKLPPPTEWQGELSWSTRVEVAAPAHVVVIEYVSFHSGGVCKRDVVLPDGGEITGRVVDSSGAGVGDANVMVMDPELTLEELERGRTFGPRLGSRAETKTSPDGSFHFRGVAPLSYRAWSMPGARRCAISDKFEVQVGARVDLPPLVVDEDADAITGTILMPDGKPCAQSRAISNWTPTQAEIRGSTNGHGGFVLKCPHQAAIDIDFVGSADQFEGSATLLGVRAGTRGLIVQLKPTHWFEAHVHDDAGKPLQAFYIDVQCPHGGYGHGVENRPDGVMRLRAPTEPFTVTAKAVGYMDRSTGPIDPDRAPDELDFELTSAPSLRGRVILDGSPVKRAELRLVRSMPPGQVRWHNGVPTPFDVYRGEQQATSGEDGAFAFTLREGGTYVICASGSSDVASGETVPIVVDPGHPPQDVLIALGHGGEVVGSILTQPGDEASYKWVQVIRPTGEAHSLPIEPGGSYRFQHLAAGRWWIRRSEDETHEGHETRDNAPFDPTARQLDITENQVTRFDLDVRATPAPVLDGHVSMAALATTEWTARFKIRDSWAFTSDNQRVSADGTFRLHLQATGPGHLVLDTPAKADRAQRIELDVRLNFGINTWSIEAETGSIAIARSSSAWGLLSHVATLQCGAKFVTDFKLTQNIPLVLDHVAAGHGQIVDASGKVLAEVDVPSGGLAQVTLP